MKAGLVGAGLIGSTLADKLCMDDWEVGFVARRSGVYSSGERLGDLDSYDNYCDGVDVAFLAIPTLDDGSTAHEYMRTFLGHGIPVVTSEKGAMSNYFAELEPSLNMIGYSATVGGGTRLLRYLREMSGSNVVEVHGVLNGTLNYVFDQVSRGRSLGEVVEETKRLGYAEPGAHNPVDVVNGELHDVAMKASIVFNSCGLATKRIRARDIEYTQIDGADLRRLVREAADRRFIVSITREDGDNDMIGGFTYCIDGWNISAGFRRVQESPMFQQLIPSGVNNALMIVEGEYGSDGTYVVKGQGAGAKPTISSMMKDAERLTMK